jgi:hypothetical protein
VALFIFDQIRLGPRVVSFVTGVALPTTETRFAIAPIHYRVRSKGCVARQKHSFGALGSFAPSGRSASSSAESKKRRVHR